MKYYGLHFTSSDRDPVQVRIDTGDGSLSVWARYAKKNGAFSEWRRLDAQYDSDGVLETTVKEALHALEADHATDADNADNADNATYAETAGVAEKAKALIDDGSSSGSAFAPNFGNAQSISLAANNTQEFVPKEDGYLLVTSKMTDGLDGHHIDVRYGTPNGLTLIHMQWARQFNTGIGNGIVPVKKGAKYYINTNNTGTFTVHFISNK